MAGLALLTTNPFTEGWRSEDQFQRQRERDYVGIDTARFGLDERRRKSAEEQMIDSVLRDAAGMDDTRISGTRSVSAPGLDRPTRAYAAPAPAGRDEPGYTTEELAPAAPNPTPTFAPGGAPESAYAEPGMGIYDRGATGFQPSTYAETIRRQENNGPDPMARNPRSTAMGNGQFIESTWLGVWSALKQNPQAVALLRARGIEPDRLSRDEILMLRGVPELAAMAIDAYAEMNAPGLRSTLGRDPSQGELRLAHGFGGGGANALLTADPNAPIDGIVGPKVMAANPHLAGKTVGDVVRQYDSTRGFVPAQAPPGGGEDAMVRQAMGGIAASPQGRALSAYPAENDLVAQAGGGMTGGGDPADFLSSRYTDPRMQYARQRLAQTPGGGAMAFGMVQNQLTDRDKLGLKVFDLIGAGRDQEAQMLAGQIGMNLPPALLRNPLMRQAVADVAKIPGLQYDSAAAVRYIREYVKNGGNSAAALDAMGDPRSRVDMPARGGAGAQFSFINRADGSLVRVNKVSGESEVIVQPGRPDQARARAAHAANEAVKNGTIPPGQYAVYMATMERALLGDPNALAELEQVITPPKAPTDTRSWVDKLPVIGQPAPTAPPRPSMANPPSAPAMPTPQAPAISGAPRGMIPGGAADYQPVAPRMSYDPATDSLVPVQ